MTKLINPKKIEGKDTLDSEIEKLLKEESAQSKAVSSLIEVKDREEGKLSSDIEVKTELNSKQICIHTAGNMLGHFLGMSEKDFSKMNIMEDLINSKERKLLSKDRKSRKEIVDIAKSPDMNLMPEQGGGGLIRNLFRKKPREL